jgi:molybdopterin converting factor small subunit
MKLDILGFGIAREIFGAPMIEAEVLPGASVTDLKKNLEVRFPRLLHLRSYLLAVNNEYASDEQTLSAHDEIAVIPPVSGG